MIAVVQRVRSASVVIEDQIVSQIGVGLCVLAAIESDDDDASLQWMANKIAMLRAFPEGEQTYHLNVSQVDGRLLLVSNFTVAATTATGRRPGFDRAMKPDAAKAMFARFVEYVVGTGVPVVTGRFGADMVVQVENDGPFTVIVQSPSRASVFA